MRLGARLGAENNFYVYVCFVRTSLRECLEMYLKEERIDEFKCDLCKRTGKVSKKTDIVKFPPLLIIHLSRLGIKILSRDCWSLGLLCSAGSIRMGCTQGRSKILRR